MPGISGIVRIFEEIELRLVKSLKRSLGRHKEEEREEGFNWSAWQAEKLRSLEKFRRENAAIMQEYTEQIDSETRRIMQEQFDEGMNGADVPPAGDQPQFFGVDTTKVNKLIEDISYLEKNAETAALRLTDDVYRQTVNRVQLAMGTGSMTLQQAIDNAVKDFLAQGINCIVYKDGRRVNIADYVRMALRTTATRAALQGKSAKYKALGYDTVQVSSYGMCSPTCKPWQGRIYIEDTFSFWDGEVKEYPDGVLWGRSDSCGKWFPLLSSAIEKGLFHPNCRHSISLWRDGDPLPESVDNTDSERRYKLEQQQRALERAVRRAKRRVEGFTDPENIRKAKAELRQAQKELSDFIDKVNADEGETVLRRDEGKEKVYEGELTNHTTSDIIRSEEVKDLEQAKKRDHKIFITDTAISRIDRVKPSDFSDRQADEMQQMHKKLLKIAKDENDSNEVLIITDSDFSSEVMAKGGEFKVSPADNPFAVSIIAHAERQSLLYLHNHPSTNIFSIGDIDTFCCEKAIKAMSVVTNQGEVYVLNKTGKYSFEATKELLTNILKSFPEGEIDDKIFVKKYLKECYRGGVEYVKAK